MAGTPPITMASLSERISGNAPGKYYVDATCIDCDQCRAQAPEFFGRNEDGLSYLLKQPATAEEVAVVEEAMTACATSSIGDDGS
jgi:ferredoxin